MTTASLGRYPTPVERVELPGGRGPLWIKRDDLTHPEYGGNKVRKLEHSLAAAVAAGKRRVFTVGAAGSHHVLATALFGGRLGLAVDAVLLPQPASPRARDNLRAALHAGLVPHASANIATGLLRLALLQGDDAAFIAIGGSDVGGALGYVDAARELADQVRRGDLPLPERIFVTFGSGGTGVGLALGLAEAGLATRVVGVCIAEPIFVVRGYAAWLMRKTAERMGPLRAPSLVREASARLELYTAELGRGYGFPTEAGLAAIDVAAEVGLTLEPTYTAKTFAAVLADGTDQARGPSLYWQTLSSAPMAPLLAGAPEALPPAMERLFR